MVCVPVTEDGDVTPSWGRARRVAVAEVTDGLLASWKEFEVDWDVLHDSGGGHHARLARFLLDHQVEAVSASHMGAPMQHMLGKMGLRVVLGASGDARCAALAAASGTTPG